MSEERLQKILAHAGVASRRAAESIIVAGRVRVNGKVVTELGAKADTRKDKVELDGNRLVAETPMYLILHKPRGVVSTMSDPEGRLTIKDFLKTVDARVYPIGRLDYATSGALLVTNDGEFSDGLLHPKREVPKTYVVKVAGTMGLDDFLLWSKGVELDDGPTKPAKVTLLRFEGEKTWMELTIKEGRNQQVRRMGEATGFPVMRLVRSSFAEISSDGLKPGAWRHLTRDELNTLKKTYGVPKSLPGAPEGALGTVTRGRGRVAGVDARGRAHGKPLERAQERSAERPRTGFAERAPERSADRPRGRSADRAPQRGADRPRGRSSERAPEPLADRPRGKSAERSREKSAERAHAKPREQGRPGARGRHSSAEPTSPPRYGGGSPGRRGYDVKEDWGGGSGRGSSGTRDEGADRAAPGGRGRATRTTGTGGGVGASNDGAGYRMQRGRKR